MESSAATNPSYALSWFGAAQIVTNWVRRDAVVEKRVWGMSITAIVLCVVSICVLYTAVGHSSLVFLQLSESQVGEADLVMLPRDGGQFLNASELQAELAHEPEVEGIAPRWVLAAQVATLAGPAPSVLSLQAVAQSQVTTRVVVYDSNLEAQLHVSRQWRHPVLGAGDCHVSSSLLRRPSIQGAPGSTLALLPDLDLVAGVALTPERVHAMQTAMCSQLPALQCACMVQALPWSPSNFTARLVAALPQLEECTGFPLAILASRMVYTCTVLDAVTDPVGKWPAALGNVVALDVSALQAHMQALFAPLRVVLPGVGPAPQLWQHAMSVNVFMRNRLEVYSRSHTAMHQALRSFSDLVAARLGLSTLPHLSTPLYSTLAAYDFLRAIFSNLAFLLVLLLAVLVALLLGALFASSLEEKSYEFGLLRALGLRTGALQGMLVARAVALALPAALLGLALAVLFYAPVAYEISAFSGAPVDLALSPSAMLAGAFLAVLLPLGANQHASQRVLAHSLRDSLDLFRALGQETVVTRIRLEELGLSPPQAVAAALLALCGGVVYYLVPYAILTGQLELFLAAMSGILLAMILGLTLLALPFIPFLERAVLYLILWRQEMLLHTVVAKNLESHRHKSRRTAAVFTLCVAYILYGTAGLELQASSLSESVAALAGADIVLARTPFIGDYLPHPALKAWLEAEAGRGDASPIAAASFVTARLSDQDGVSSSAVEKLYNFALVPRGIKVHVVAVEENLLDATFDRFAVVASTDMSPAEGGDVVRSLYSTSGLGAAHGLGGDWRPPKPVSGKLPGYWHPDSTEEVYRHPLPMLLSEGFQLALSVGPATPPMLAMSNNERHLLRLGLVRATLSKMPGFIVSGYKTLMLTGLTPVIVSVPSFQQLLSLAVRQPGLLRYDKLFIRLRDTSVQSRRYVTDALRTILQADSKQIIVDTTEALASLQSTVAIISLLANTVATMAFILVFFLSWAAFDANVRDHAWELGVLRAIGLSGAQVVRVYVYEAICVVFASTFAGALIGLATSVTLTLQFDVISEMPFAMAPPVLPLLQVIVGCGLIAAVASYVPAKKLTAKPIASILKGANL